MWIEFDKPKYVLFSLYLLQVLLGLHGTVVNLVISPFISFVWYYGRFFEDCPHNGCHKLMTLFLFYSYRLVLTNEAKRTSLNGEELNKGWRHDVICLFIISLMSPVPQNWKNPSNIIIIWARFVGFAGFWSYVRLTKRGKMNIIYRNIHHPFPSTKVYHATFKELPTSQPLLITYI